MYNSDTNYEENRTSKTFHQSPLSRHLARTQGVPNSTDLKPVEHVSLRPNKSTQSIVNYS